MVFLLVLVLVLVAVVLVFVVRRRYRIHIRIGGWLPQRIFTYTLAFAALIAVLFAVAILLTIAIGTVTRQLGAVSASDLRSRASLAVAALIVGLPIWLALWSAIRRRLATSPEARDALERRVFLSAVFASTAIIALFSLQTALQALLTLPGPSSDHLPAVDSFDAVARALVFSTAWLIFARLGWRERSPRARDPIHDLAVYAIAVCALGVLWVGLMGAVQQIAIALVGQEPTDQPAQAAWTIWGQIGSELVAGGGVWAAYLIYDLARGGRRLLRVLYIYGVLAYSGFVTLLTGVSGICETLRRVFGYHPPEGDWVFLSDPNQVTPWVVSGGLVWAVHWLILRHQARLVDAAPAAGAVPWPRRPALATMAFVGLCTWVSGALFAVWIGFDAVFGSAATEGGQYWWRDTLSTALALIPVGLAVWLPSWLSLQRAASVAPNQERTSWERRLLVGGLVILTGLSALGFLIAWLWQALRIVLGDTLDATVRASLAQFLCLALATAAVAAVHWPVLRDDMRVKQSRKPRTRVIAFITEGSGDLLAELRADPGLHIQVAGRIVCEEHITGAADLLQRLAASEDRDHPSGALLILGAHGGSLYPFLKGGAG